MVKKTNRPQSPAAPPFKITVPLPTTKKKKKTGPAGGPKPKKKDKAIDKLKKKFQGIPAKKKQKLTEDQKKNVEKDATVMEKQDIPGTPHFRMVPKKSGSGTKIMEAKGGGLMEATKRLKAQGLKKGGFPDLSGDGKVTMKDILMGRGVVKKPKKKAEGGSIESIFKLAKAAKPSGRLNVDDIKRATPGKPSMTLKKGKLKGVKDAPEERRKERQLKSFDKLAGARGVAGAMKGALQTLKKAGRLAKRGYGKARK